MIIKMYKIVWTALLASTTKLLLGDLALTFFFANFAFEQLATLAFSIRANSSVLADGIAALRDERVRLLDDNVCTLHGGSELVFKFKLDHGPTVSNNGLRQ